MRRNSSEEERCFVVLMTESGPALLAYFERRVGQEGADLLAETMAIAWRRRARLPREAEPARMWLFGVARNVLKNSYRTGLRRQRLADRLRMQTELTAAADPFDAVATRDLVTELGHGLAEVVTLVHWEGFSLAEIGVILGVPASTVRGRYQRALRMLRASMTLAAEEPHEQRTTEPAEPACTGTAISTIE